MATKKSTQPGKRKPRYKTVDGSLIKMGGHYELRCGEVIEIQKYDHGDAYPVEGSPLDYERADKDDTEYSWNPKGYYFDNQIADHRDIMRPYKVRPIGETASIKIPENVKSIQLSVTGGGGHSGANSSAAHAGQGGVGNVGDLVNHPLHYTQHPSGVECIQITEHMGFNLGNAIKYIWRADLKGDSIQDLEKAKWYLDREIAKRKKA